MNKNVNDTNKNKRKNEKKMNCVIDGVRKKVILQANDKPIKEGIFLLKKEIKKSKIDADVLIGGSYAKKTYLSNDFDVDIFIRFKKQYEKENISDLLEKILKRIFKKITKVHGSRDYFQIEYKKIKFEIVPVLRINKCDNVENTTDCSALHVKWIKEKIRKNKNLPEEIRIGKLFLKANRLYGAESYIRGFSGHVLDILITYYGSFKKLIKNATKWKEKTYIDVEKHYKNKKEALLKINKSKTNGPLIVIDPIDKKRNAAASLSKENFEKFIGLCQKFIKNPKKRYFEIKKIDESNLKKPFIKIRINVLKNKSSDVAGTKAYKVIEYLSTILKHNKYSNKFLFEWDKKNNFIGYIILNKKDYFKLEYIKEGPYITQKTNIKNFKRKNKRWFIRGKRVYAKVKKKKVNKILKEFITEEYLKNKIKKIEDMEIVE